MNLAEFNLVAQELMAFFQLSTVHSLESSTAVLFVFVASCGFMWLALFVCIEHRGFSARLNRFLAFLLICVEIQFTHTDVFIELKFIGRNFHLILLACFF